jgi:hypothetical protein
MYFTENTLIEHKPFKPPATNILVPHRLIPTLTHQVSHISSHNPIVPPHRYAATSDAATRRAFPIY